MASSDIDRASNAIDPPSNAEAMASELRFWPIMCSIALSTTAPAWLRWAGLSFASSDIGLFLHRVVFIAIRAGVGADRHSDLSRRAAGGEVDRFHLHLNHAAPSAVMLEIMLDGLQRPHPGIKATSRQQGGMAAAFGYETVIKNDDLVGVDDGG
jgi:hypothetical protein